jgi:hypothetical protein
MKTDCVIFEISELKQGWYSHENDFKIIEKLICFTGGDYDKAEKLFENILTEDATLRWEKFQNLLNDYLENNLLNDYLENNWEVVLDKLKKVLCKNTFTLEDWGVEIESFNINTIHSSESSRKKFIVESLSNE